MTPLLYVATAALLVTILSLAQVVLVPMALAVMLTFVLTPPVKALERKGLNRAVAVAVVTVLVLGVVGGFGYVLNRQFNDLAAQMPKYSNSIKKKFAALRESRKGAITDIQKTVEEVSKELDKQELKEQIEGDQKSVGKAIDVKRDIQPVLVVPSEPTDVERLRSMIEPIFEPLATAGIVLVLTIFMLIQREDLRNRFIRLVGQLALAMLSQLFDPLTCEVEQLSTATLTAEVLSAVEKGAPDLVCVIALPPGGLAQARYLCKRLRARFPEMRILVVRPGVQSDADKLIPRLIESGADRVAGSLTEARTQATQLLLPALIRPVESDSTVGTVEMAGSPA